MNKIYKVIWNIQLGYWQGRLRISKKPQWCYKKYNNIDHHINKDGVSTSQTG